MHSFRCICLLIVGAACFSGCASRPSPINASRPSPIKLFWDFKWEEASCVDYVRDQIKLAEDHMARGNYIRARWAFGRVHKKSRSLINRGNAMVGIALCRYCRYSDSEAAENLMKAVELYGNYISYEQALELELQIARSLNKPTGLLTFRHRDTAIRLLRHIVRYAPYSQYGPKALAAVCRISQGEGDHKAAILGFEKFLTMYENNPLAKMMGIKLIESLLTLAELGDGEYRHERRARAEILQLMLNKPGEEIVAKLGPLRKRADRIDADHLLFLGEFYQRPAHSGYDAAKRYLNTISVKYKELEQATEAEKLKSRIPKPLSVETM